MKNFKLLFAYLGVFGLLFTSCTKDEESVTNNGEKATLSFATVLNDMVSNKAAMKQAVNGIPECSDEAPAYVHVVLSGTENVGTTTNPLVIDVSPNPGDYDGDGENEYFTEESTQLELTPGVYSLEHFVVYDSNDNIIWVAPMTGGSMAGFVETTLPMDFNLGTGAKKYVDVEVLCYDDRMVNEYGYLFFDLETTEAIEFCVFGNFCPPSGRHYPAEYSVDVWSYVDGETGSQLFSGSNTVELDENGDYAGSVLCMALPDTEGEDQYYIEITLLSSDAYGNVEERIIRAGVINDDEVRGLFDGENNLDYYHFREGCENGDTPPIIPDPTSDAEHYKTCLYQTNNSGALGFAYFSLEGNVLTSTVIGVGLTPNKEHPQHIHGFEDGSDAMCPPTAADVDNDGLISLAEGLPFYGPVLLPLVEDDDSFPVANGMGMYTQVQTYTLGSADDLNPLQNRVVVIHGRMVNGEYNATLPVACGEIMHLDDY